MKVLKLLDIEKEQKINLRKKKLSKTQDKKKLISIGANNFDLILGGGLASGKVYLIFGGPQTGKTQLSHQICVQGYKILSEENYSPKNKYIIYFDTENTFRPERLQELTESQEIANEKLFKSILVSKIMSNSALLMGLDNIEDKLAQEPIQIFIIDSINNHFRSEKGSKETSLAKTKAEFMSILEKIRKLTIHHNLITVLTAQVIPNFMDSPIIQELPVGLQYLNHFFSEEIYLKHKEEKKCYAHLVNSHNLPERKLLYKITRKGIRDFKI